jgi:hypothetical protein
MAEPARLQQVFHSFAPHNHSGLNNLGPELADKTSH